MQRKLKDLGNIREVIEISMESVEKIDNLIRSGSTLFTSRDDFIRSAVEIKLNELKDLNR